MPLAGALTGQILALYTRGLIASDRQAKRRMVLMVVAVAAIAFGFVRLFEWFVAPR